METVPTPDPAPATTVAKAVAPSPTPPSRADRDPGANPNPQTPEGSEWEAVEPTTKDMGLVRLTLDRGVKTTVIGQLYGLDFEIDGSGFSVRVFFDNYNRRLKVIDYEATDYRALCERLIWLASSNGYDKIFVKTGRKDWQEFLSLGFILEGILKYYYRGEDAYVLSRFSSLQRALSQRVIAEADLIETLMAQPRGEAHPPLHEDYRGFLCEESHIPGLVALYRRVFKTYPSPLTHPDYIQQTMRRNIIYRAFSDPTGHIVAAASADLNHKDSNAELTDCATLPEHRGAGMMQHLIASLETDLREHGILTGYSLARARSHGMNRVFYSLGYEYSGRLINNCDIQGEYEDMNIWVKPLSGVG